MAVRVLRLMEYVYPDVEAAHIDMERWQVQGIWVKGLRPGHEIRSTVILNPTPIEHPYVRDEEEERAQAQVAIEKLKGDRL